MIYQSVAVLTDLTYSPLTSIVPLTGHGKQDGHEQGGAEIRSHELEKSCCWNVREQAVSNATLSTNGNRQQGNSCTMGGQKQICLA
jgi:hypothetical protein